MSEENKLAPYEERKDWEFTVNIGLCKNGEPIAGVVLVPAAPDGPVMYKGVVGLGPPVREVDDPLGYDSYKSIFCKAFQESDEGLTVVASKSHNTPETDAFVAKYKNPKVESKGSSLKLLMVAEGRAHVYPRLAPTSEWDTCAAHAIVLCAGGQVLQHAGGVACDAGKPMVYNKPNVLNPFFVVYGKREARPTGPKKDVDLGGGGSIRMPLLLVAVAVALSAAAYVALA